MTKSKSGPEFLKIPFKFNMSEFSSAWLKFQLVGFIQHSSQLKSLWKWILSSMVLAVFPGFNPPAAAKSLQSFLTLCDPIDGSLSGSTVPGILQARTLEWVTISFSNAWKWKVKVKLLSRVQLPETPWTAAYQGLPSMGFSRQEYWSGVPLPSPLIHLQIW